MRHKRLEPGVNEILPLPIHLVRLRSTVTRYWRVSSEHNPILFPSYHSQVHGPVSCRRKRHTFSFVCNPRDSLPSWWSQLELPIHTGPQLRFSCLASSPTQINLYSATGAQTFD